MKKYLGILLTLVLTLSLVSCGGKEAEKEINIGYLRVPNDETVAKEKKLIDDYFAEKGVKVNYLTVDSGVEANKAFASGSLDFATGGNTNAVVSLATGLDTELIWIHEVIGSAEALVVRKGSGIEKVEDLKGKKIATTFSSTSHYILLNILKEAGIDKDVELLDMLTPDIVAAWQRGDIDAAYTWEPSLSKILASEGEVLIDSADMIAKGYVTANVGQVRKKFAEENPELVIGLLQQLMKAHEIYKDTPEVAIKAAADELQITEEEAKFQMEGSIWLSPQELVSEQYFGTSESSGKFANVMYDTAIFLEENDSISKVPSLEEFQKFVNPYYIEKAMK